LAEAIGQKNLPGVTVDADYQLTVEDAADVAKFDIVIFADAAVSGAEPFWIKRIEPSESGVGFSSHSIDARSVLALAKRLFHGEPEAYLLGMRGYEFNEFEESLSAKAKENLAATIDHLTTALQSGKLEEVRSDEAAEPVDHCDCQPKKPISCEMKKE